MEQNQNAIGWMAGREWRLAKESDDPLKMTDWEVKQLATQLYIVYQSNPRKVEENGSLALKAVMAAIDFQLAWNQEGKPKQMTEQPASR